MRSEQGELEAGDLVGGYRLIEPLGRGGMGVVFRARPPDGRDDVALKTVRAPDERYLGSLRREIRALSRIRHPTVVRIVDHGVDDGLPWMAMEMVEGETLRRRFAGLGGLRASVGSTHSRDADTVAAETLPIDGALTPTGQIAATVLDDSARGAPREEEEEPRIVYRIDAERLAAAVRVVSGLCDGLSFLHGEGIVHRDLKPDNVLMRSDGSPVIVDFGVATRFGGAGAREALGARRGVVGTASYVAPEQLRDELVDARADLYSLGCIFYELLAARAPYEQVDVDEETHARLRRDAPPLSHYAQGIPEDLEALIMRLVSRRPSDRIGYADDVKAALFEHLPEGAQSRGGPRARPYLYRPGFAGREAPLANLVAAVGRAAAGRGGVILVGGPSGMGKTRLILEAAREADRHSVLVLLGECDASRADALTGLRRPLQTIADHCRAGGDEVMARILGDDAALLGIYEPAIRSLTGDAPAISSSELHAGVCASLSRSLERLAEERPVVLVLDDLQWADDLTLAWLRAVSESGAFASSKVLVIGSYRSDEVSGALQSMLALEQVEKMLLDRLDRVAIDEMVRGMLSMDTAPENLTSVLTRHSEGNPFFVAEYLHAAVDDGLLYRDESGRWKLRDRERLGPLPIPQSIQELVMRRLDELGEEAIELAEVASVFGREVDADLLGAASELDTAVVLDATSDLLRRKVLEERAPGRLSFVHDKLREVTYARMSKSVAAARHRLAARVLSEQDPSSPDQLAAIAAHHDRGGSLRRAVELWVRAAEAAEARGALPEAIAHCATAVDRARESKQRAASLSPLMLRGGILTRQGALGDARQDIDAAAALAEELGDADSLARCHADLSYVSYLAGDGDATLRHAERASEVAGAVDDDALQARIENTLGIAWGSSGHFRRAIGHYSRAAELARKTGDERTATKQLGNISINYRLLGQLELAHEYAAGCLEAARAIDEPLFVCNALNNVGRVEIERGRSAAAASVFAEALDIALDADVGFAIVEAHYGLASTALQLGDIDRAARESEQMLRVADARGFAVGRGQALRLIGAVSLARRQMAEARRSLEESVAVLRATGERDELAESLVTLAGAHAADEDRAAGLLAEARRLFQELGMTARLDALEAPRR